MNKYEEAISTSFEKEFLLGRGKYFVRDRDREGHDSTDTYAEILAYEKEIGEANVYDKLNEDLYRILRSEFLSIYDLNHLLGIIWSYFLNKKEKKLLERDWVISNSIKIEIRNQIGEHIANGAELGSIYWKLDSLKHRFNYNLLEG